MYSVVLALLLAAAAIAIHFGRQGWYTVGERGRFAEYFGTRNPRREPLHLRWGQAVLFFSMPLPVNDGGLDRFGRVLAYIHPTSNRLRATSTTTWFSSISFESPLLHIALWTATLWCYKFLMGPVPVRIYVVAAMSRINCRNIEHWTLNNIY